MEFALDVGRRKDRLVSHAAIPAREGGRWPYFISAVWEEGEPPRERDALRDMVRRLAGYLESANELLEEQGEDEEDCADSARLVTEARALIGEPAEGQAAEGQEP